jgi:fluoride exporter
LKDGDERWLPRPATRSFAVMILLLIALGGGIGSVARYLFGAFVSRQAHAGFPFGTLAVNIVGSIAIGMLTRFFLHSQTEPYARAALVVGFCGGFTTFSTFSLETMGLINGGEWAKAAMYMGLSLVACVGGTAIGLAVGPRLNP